MAHDNIRITRKGGIAALLAMATLAGGLGLAATADAAGTSTITLNAAQGKTMDGISVTAYKLGSYADPVASADGATIDAVNVKDVDADTGAWIKDALDDSKVTGDAAYDNAGNLAKLGEGDASTQRTVAKNLAAADTKPAATVPTTALKGTTQTLTVPSDGLYLLTFGDKGMPIIVGTTIDGKRLTKMTGDLGTATLKATGTDLDKKILSKDGKTSADNGTATVGSTRQFTATFQVPAQNTNPKKLTYTDTPTGMAWDGKQPVVKIDDNPVTGVTATKQGDGFTIDLTGQIANNWGKTVTITYANTITAVKAENKATVTANLDGVDVTNEDTVNAPGYPFQIKKTNTAGQTLNGAGFTIKDTATGKYLTWHPAATPTDDKPGTWTESGKADAGQVFSGDTNADGTVDAKDDASKKGIAQFQGLSAGNYEVVEETVPDGFLKAGAATFTVSISDKGVVSIVQGSANNGKLITTDGNGVITVQNISSITQLPLTGGFQTALIGLGGLLTVIGAAAGGVVVVRRIKSDPIEAAHRPRAA